VTVLFALPALLSVGEIHFIDLIGFYLIVKSCCELHKISSFCLVKCASLFEWFFRITL
jgi:hypothetical protein